jgi:alpha-aminoadipate carrier protein LysW
MTLAECISCGAEIKFSAKPKMGALVTCPDCTAELEVVWLDPVELDWPYEEGDYDDDEDYYDDEDY